MEFVIAVVAALPRKGEQRWLQRRLQDSEVFFFFFCHRRLPEKEQQLSLLEQVITAHREAEFSEKNEVKKERKKRGPEISNRRFFVAEDGSAAAEHRYSCRGRQSWKKGAEKQPLLPGKDDPVMGRLQVGSSQVPDLLRGARTLWVGPQVGSG